MKPAFTEYGAIQWTNLWDFLEGYIPDGDFWINVLVVVIKIIVIWIGGRILIRLLDKAIRLAVERREKGARVIDVRRSRTLGKLASNIIVYAVQFMVILLILGQLGFDLVPLLAGVGVVGLAIGFGAQSLVKDIITGFFILFEDQFAVGDVIQTGSFKGTVEEIGLRVTKIRNWTGELHIIPNGSIVNVTNYSLNNAVGFVDVFVASNTDLNVVKQVIREAIKKVYVGSENLVKEPEFLGVQAVGKSDLTLRLMAECKPLTQANVFRDLSIALNQALNTAGIEQTNPPAITISRTEGA
jgi:small conductance mechanosensitive channel